MRRARGEIDTRGKGEPTARARLASNAVQAEIERLWALHWDVQQTRERGMCTRKEAKNAELGIFDRLFEVAEPPQVDPAGAELEATMPRRGPEGSRIRARREYLLEHPDKARFVRGPDNPHR